jgi:hypothetical protein
MSIFLVAFLSCNHLSAIANRLQNIAILTTQQKNEIMMELIKVVPTCPVIIHQNEQHRKRV